MAAPFEIVAAPFTIYVAAVGTAFPDVSAVPAAAWKKLGTSGDKNYDEEGVTVTHGQSIESFRPVGSTAKRKGWRTEEDLIVEFTLVDVSAVQYARSLNDAAITTTAPGSGVGGQDSFNLLQGKSVKQWALLARGISPANDAFAAQYQVPIVQQEASPAPVGRKGAPMALACQFVAYEDDTLGFGKFVVQTAAPV